MKHCLNLMAPDDEELLASIFGEETLDEARKQHIQHCSTCQQRLKDYQQTHATLLSGLYRTFCPSPTLLSLYCENKLPTDQESLITTHLSECLLCSDEIADLRGELHHFNPFPFSSRQPAPEPGPESFWHLLKEGMKVFVAQFVTPSPGIALDLRKLHEDPSAPIWPWRYEVEPYHLAFQPRRIHNDIQLIGMFENMTPAQLKALEGAAVDLYDATPPRAITESEPSDTHKEQHQPVLSTTLDDLGNFSFAAVPPGSYLVIIHLPDTELVVEGLRIT
jgi:hypothetical protein